MSENETNVHEEVQLSPEEMAELRAKTMKFYEEELPFLRVQEEYERLRADVEEHKARALQFQVQVARFYAQAEAYEEQANAEKNAGGTGDPPPTPDSSTSAVPPTGKRKLKTQ